MKILIQFGDNDFQKVLEAFGELLAKHNFSNDFITRERVVQWFNAVAPTLYEIVQNKGDYPISVPKGYLSITPDKVLIGKAADDKLDSAHEWANYDAVCIDLKRNTHFLV